MTNSFSGGERLTSSTSEYNALEFIVRAVAGRAWTSTLVQIVAVGTGTVDVQPMVHQIDGLGNVTPHGTVHNLPVWQLQGGSGGVIVTPALGDIGLALFAREDISTVKRTRAPAAPGSRRRNDPSDGIYLGGVLNAAPTIFVQIDGSGITLSAGEVRTTDNLRVGNGASGTFTTPAGQTVTVADGIITNIF